MESGPIATSLLELPSAAAPRRTWAELHGGALSLAAAEAAARHEGPVCVIAPSAAEADRLEREMAFFGRRAAAPLPRLRDAALRADLAAAGPARGSAAGAESARARRARDADRRGRRTARAAAAAGVHRLALAVSRERRPVRSRSTMTKRLSEHGYLRVEQVAEPGEFAVRGAVFDVFPTGSAAPVRIDLFDDEIETLAHVRRADAALGRQDRQDRDPARARISVRRGRDQVLSRALSRAFSRRARALPRLPHDLRRATAGRHRVLPAVVLQDDGVAVRLSARRHAVHRRRRRARRARERRGSSSKSATSSCTATSSGRSLRRRRRSGGPTSCARASTSGRR